VGKKTIVLTLNGTDDSVEHFSISLFDCFEGYYAASQNNAGRYCDMINNLELTDGKWIYARIIGENEQISLEKPVLFSAVTSLDDHGIQRVLREVSIHDLACALVGTNKTLQEKIFKNMSKRSAQMVKEEMELVSGISAAESKSFQRKIIAALRTLSEHGEIVIVRQ
jgi:flagellar motor switch protein FliG